MYIFSCYCVIPYVMSLFRYVFRHVFHYVFVLFISGVIFSGYLFICLVVLYLSVRYFFSWFVISLCM